ncbi:MAG TPA: hypothetical protein VMG12_34760 [Polyangiaceae bacterium]|nr:hypothetical protein [Polyangiaceae bacterium]
MPLPPPLPPAPTTDVEAAPADGGRELWTARAHNAWIPLVLVLVLGHGAVMNLLLQTTAAAYLNAAHLLVLLGLELLSTIRVSVDAHELCIRYGHLGWLRQRIAVARIEAARGFRLEAMEHGGYGYRGSLRFSRRAALVVRSGSALGLELDGGKHLSISVDDAERGADVLNRLIDVRTARSRHAAPG